MPRRDFAFALKKPVDRMISSSSPGGEAARAATSGKRRKSSGVTMLTRTSVHCAERTVATRSSSGLRKSSEHAASPYRCSSRFSVGPTGAAFRTFGSAISEAEHNRGEPTMKHGNACFARMAVLRLAPGESRPVTRARLRGSGRVRLALVSSIALAAEGRVVVTILETTDLHGHLLPWDYQRAQPADEGLARVASRVAAIRKETPNVLLLDAGDTIQGTPIEFLHAKDPSKGPDPMAEAMSALKYDAMSVGNHEFNFGLAVLRKAQKESSFPWLSSNTRNVSDGSAAFPEYLVKTVAGIRIGVLGLTTPNIPNWEPARNRPGLRWEDPVDTAKRLVPVLRGKEKCDFVVALIHSGPEIDLKTGEPDGTDDENRVAALSKVPGIDLLLTGHTHRRIPLTRLNGVPMIQPGRWGDVLARVDVTFETSGGKVTVADVSGALLPSDASVATDAGDRRDRGSPTTSRRAPTWKSRSPSPTRTSRARAPGSRTRPSSIS